MASSARSLSDLNSGYAGDVTEAEDDGTLSSCSDKGHGNSCHNLRRHKPMDSTTISKDPPA